MANPNPKKKFQKGNQAAKGNFVAPKIYEGRRLTRVIYEEILHKYLHCTKAELEAIGKDPNTTAIELLVVSVMAKAITNGDDKRVEFLLARLLGKVPEHVKFTDETEEKTIKDMALKLLEIAKEPN